MLESIQEACQEIKLSKDTVKIEKKFLTIKT